MTCPYADIAKRTAVSPLARLALTGNIEDVNDVGGELQRRDLLPGFEVLVQVCDPRLTEDSVRFVRDALNRSAA